MFALFIYLKDILHAKSVRLFILVVIKELIMRAEFVFSESVR